MDGTFLLLIAHDIGDYYLQTGRTSARKSESYVCTLYHCIYYAFPFVTLALIYPLCRIPCIYAIIAHAIIDMVKCCYVKHVVFAKMHTKILYVIDQALHLASIIFISYLCLPHGLSHPYMGDFWYFLTAGQPAYVTYQMYQKEQIYNTLDSRGIKEKIKLLLVALGMWCWVFMIVFIGVEWYQLNKSENKKDDMLRMKRRLMVIAVIRVLLWIISRKG